MTDWILADLIRRADALDSAPDMVTALTEDADARTRQLTEEINRDAKELDQWQQS